MDPKLWCEVQGCTDGLATGRFGGCAMLSDELVNNHKTKTIKRKDNMKSIQVVQMTTRETHLINTFEPRSSFLKRHEDTILEILFGAYFGYLIIQLFIN